MAIELVDTASSAGDGCGGGCSSGTGATSSNSTHVTPSTFSGLDDLVLLDDWATGEQDHLALSGEPDENAWNMDSIDVASCFAGTSSYAHHHHHQTTHSVSTVNPTTITLNPSTSDDVAAAIADADPLFGASLSQWWPSESDIDSTNAVDVDMALVDSIKSVAGLYPSMAPLKQTSATPYWSALMADTSTSSATATAVPDKDVTDALLAVFAPHAGVSDDALTDSGTESTTKRQLAHVASPASSVSSSASSTSASTATSATRVSTAKKPKARATVKLEVADDERDLTPLEIRRKRNRESMQRARQRQRDDVEEMKETLHELEQHYQKLSAAAAEERRTGASDLQSTAALVPSALTHQPSLSTELQPQHLGADYYAAADLSHTLKEEKFLLESMLTEKQKTFRRMQQVMVDRVEEFALPCPTTTTPETLFNDFEFTPITEAQSNALIRQCYLSILQFQDAATPLTPPRGMAATAAAETKPPRSTNASHNNRSMVTKQPFPPTATFGWKVSCHVTTDENFFVSFAKYFKGVSAEEAMLNTWTRTMNPQVDRSPHRRLLRYQVLQVINDSTYVAGMDIHHPVKPNKQMRNTFCRFRLQTDANVYVIGRASMNPKSPELRRQAEMHATFEYVDNYSWIEFSSAVDPASGENGVWVKFNARTEYNTQEDSHLRLVNSLFLTLKWERAVIPNVKPGFFLPS